MATAARGVHHVEDRGTIPCALAVIAAGEPVVIVDDEDRENEGDLIVAAELITPASMAFLVRQTSGFVCVAQPGEECGRRDLPPMRSANQDTCGTAYTVTVDATNDVTTGISAGVRAHTARVLADPRSRAGDLTRPGHVVTLRARDGGVLQRAGHTETAVDLTRLAGLRPAGVLCEVVSTRHQGEMARRPELVDFAAEHGLQMDSIAELVAHRRRTEPQVAREAATNLPTEHGGFQVVGYRGCSTEPNTSRWCAAPLVVAPLTMRRGRRSPRSLPRSSTTWALRPLTSPIAQEPGPSRPHSPLAFSRDRAGAAS
jgi:3,4-dihydroxy 2-butanone 4-phosphate synthase/GTP cyclohydrolase II